MKLIICILASLLSFSAFAQYSGEYSVKKGYTESLLVSETEQLGKIRVVLKNTNHSKHKKSKIVINGIIRGILNPDYTLTHTLVNKDRTGVIYTAGDTITEIYAGDPICSDGITPFKIEETINLVAGSGIYSGVQYGSFIILKGVVNNCPMSPEYGISDFEVIGGSVYFQ